MKKSNQGNYALRNVMLIDDNEIDNFINQKMLESVSLTEKIMVFSGGKSAYEFLVNVLKSSSPEELLPELVFLDIDMPMMDGFQFLDNINSLGPAIEGIKFIILTTSINPHDQEKAENNRRVISFVNKPLTAEFLENLKTSISFSATS